MGKLIICSGKQAVKPYYFKLTNTKIYSIEELCYYIYCNIEDMTEEFFGQVLVTWLKEEVQLEGNAEKLQELLNVGAGLKDIVVCILCSSDYYSEIEIKELLNKMDELAKLTPLQKMKRKGDNYLKYRQFTEAATEYENILNGTEASSLTSGEYGDIVHNLAVVQMNTTGVLMAADSFKDAYDRNQRAETLRQYLYALKVGKQDEKFVKESLSYGVSQETQEQIEKDVQLKFTEAEAVNPYQVVEELIEYKKSGKISQYYQKAEELTIQWKEEFRRENS